MRRYTITVDPDPSAGSMHFLCEFMSMIIIIVDSLIASLEITM